MMDEWLKFLFICSLCLGAWTSVNLWVNHAGPKKVRQFTGVFVLVLLVPPLVGYLQLISTEIPAFFSFVRSTLTWWYGPLMYFIAREMLLLPNTPRGIANHVCAVCGLFVVTQLLISSAIPYGYFVIVTAVVAAYCTLAGHTLVKNASRLRRLNSSYRKSTFYWLQYLLAGLLLLCAMDIGVLVALHSNVHLDFLALNSIACIFAIYVNGIVLFTLIKPALFELDDAQTIEYVQTNTGEQYKISEVAADESTAAKNNVRYLELSDQVATTLINTLATIMETDKPHLEPDENLTSMAGRLGITTHMFSELLNVHLNTNFYDWMNSYRFKAALLLLQDQTVNYSVTDIAFQAGFNNRNSFYRVFKANLGITPAQYRKLYKAELQKQA